MKSIEDIVINRRSIRRYTREKLSSEQVDFICEAIRNVPTSYNGQQFSVIAIEDQTAKEELYQITGQKQIRTCALFMVFCVDYHKIRVSAHSKGIPVPRYEATVDGYTVGVIDASIAMTSAMIAAESLGLGCCCVGYTRTSNPTLISEKLGLPSGVSIVCGLCIGFPNEQPDIKPKQPVDIVVHRERYDSDDMLSENLIAYDRQISQFNRERAGDKTDNDWTSHIVDYYSLEMRHSIGEYLDEQLGLQCKSPQKDQ